MFLSMTLIAEDLGSLCSRIKIISSEKSLVLSHVELLNHKTNPEELSEKAVYLARASSLRPNFLKKRKIHIVCAGLLEDPSIEEEAYDLIEVENATVSSLLTTIQHIFLKYNEWENRLKDVLLRHGTVADLCDEALDIAQSDILVHDRNMRTIAFKTHANAKADNPLASLKQNEVFNRDIMSGFMKSVEKNLKGGDPFSIRGVHFWTSSYGTQSLSMNVFANERCIARVAFISTSTDLQPTKKDVALITTLCTYVRSVLSTSFSNLLAGGNDVLSTLMVKMIKGETVSRTDLETTTRMHQWNYWDDTYLLAAIRILDHNEGVLSARYPLVSVFSRISEMIPNAHPFLLDDQGFAIVNLSKSSVKSATMNGILQRIGRESCCDFGICREFVGLKRLKQAHAEATASLAYSLETPNPESSHVFRIDNVALPLVDACIAEKVPPLSFCPEGLLRLIHHDNVHKSKLYETMRTYIEANNSPTKCSKTLFIQRSTFQYRYKKSLQIMDMDLEDPRTQLHLRLAFRLLDRLSPREFEAI